MANRKARRAMTAQQRKGEVPIVAPSLEITEDQILDLINGKVTVDNETLNYFLDRYREAKAQHADLSTGAQELNLRLEQTKKMLNQTVGKLNGYADDLRHWMKRLSTPEKAPLDPSKTYGPSIVKPVEDDNSGDGDLPDSAEA